MNKCYCKSNYRGYMVVNSKNAKRLLKIINGDEFDTLGCITKEGLLYLHEHNKYVGYYKYGYYDLKTHELVFGEVAHKEYEPDDYGSWGNYYSDCFTTKDKETRCKCNGYLVFSTRRNEKTKEEEWTYPVYITKEEFYDKYFTL